VTVIYLGRQLPAVSSSLPEADGGTSSPLLLLGLAPGGVCLAAAVTGNAGGPLTPPFHPRLFIVFYIEALRFSVALCRRVAAPGC